VAIAGVWTGKVWGKYVFVILLLCFIVFSPLLHFDFVDGVEIVLLNITIVISSLILGTEVRKST
jgi:hypothetical protein